MGDVHDLAAARREKDLATKRALVETLERRQQDRLLFIAEIQALWDRRQRELDGLKREVEEATDE